MPDIQKGTKDVEELIEKSVQPKAQGRTPQGFTGILNYMAGSTYRIAPWWSPQRDVNLEIFVKDCNHLSGAVSMLTSKIVTIPIHVAPRDPSIAVHQRQAEELTIQLNEESEFGQGLHVALSKGLEDWFCADNGMFYEVIGDGKPDGPIKGPALGLAHLDSHRCQRTGDPEFPVLYLSPQGARHKLHRTRVAFASDMPSAREMMLGVGLCSVSRVTAVAQNLLDISTFKMEKMGSRPKRGILVGKGITVETIIKALSIADDQMDSRGLSVFSQLCILADLEPDTTLEMLELTSVPDGFEEETSTRLSMFAIALGFNVPIRWIWPAATSGATKADAMYQHIAGLGGGVGKVLKVLTMLLGGDPRGSTHGAGKFLPSHLKLVIDFQDDEQDRMRAEIGGRRADTRAKNLEAGVTDVRTSRQKALTSGDIDQAQFDRMEIEDGRTPSGIPLLSLFSNAKEPYLSWLDLGVPNPMMTSQNDPVDMLAEINTAAINLQSVLANTTNTKKIGMAEMCLAALNALKGLYAPMAQQVIQRDVFAKLGIGGTGELPEEEVEQEPTEEEEEEEAAEEQTEQGEATEEQPSPEEEQPVPEEEPVPEETKIFDYGVGVGEIIGGQLARGAGGRFMNMREMQEMIRSGMIEAQTGAGGPLVNLATEKRADNRALLAEKLGIPVELLDGLAGMKTGETTPEDEQALVERGLAQVNYDGSITMTGPGRSMLAAANSGDVDKAEKAGSDGKEAKAKEEAKGKGKGKDKGKTAKQRREEAKEAKTKEEAENREKVADKMDDEDAGMVDDLNTFANGEEISEEKGAALAQAGLAEYDSDGKLRMTSSGRKFMKAANQGEVRDALDTLSIAREKVDKVAENIESLRESADELDETADKLDTSLAEAEVEYAKLADDPDTDPDRLKGARAKLDAYHERVAEYKKQAEEARERADALEKQIGGATTGSTDSEVDEEEGASEAAEEDDEEETEGGALLGRLMAEATASETEDEDEKRWSIARGLADATEAVQRAMRKLSGY